MIVDMPGNKALNSIVTELFVGGRKLNTSLVSITQSCTITILLYQKELDLLLYIISF